MLVTEKGQVTIPKAIRESSGIGPGSEVDFELTEDGIVIRAAKDHPSRGQRLIQRLRSRGQGTMTTDEIMALTRGADGSQ